MISKVAAQLRILAWIDRTPRWKRCVLWTFFGKDYCPNCQKVTKWRWWRSPEILPDDPPMFTQWVCRECGEGTGPELTEPFVKALESRMDDAEPDERLTGGPRP